LTAHEGDYTEDYLIQQPAILRFQELGWEVADCFEEKCGVQGTLGRETRAEVVLVSKLRPALERLNPEASAEAIDLAIEELTRDRSAQSPPQANREIYQLLKDGDTSRRPRGLSKLTTAILSTGGGPGRSPGTLLLIIPGGIMAGTSTTD